MSYQFFKRLWYSLPLAVRSRINSFPLVGSAKRKMLDTVYAEERHNDMYDLNYYRDLDAKSLPSGRMMAKSLAELCSPQSVVDVGCGSGALLYSFQELGITTLRGYEYSKSGIEFCQNRGLDVKQFDLRSTLPEDLVCSDLVCSFEVGEHLPDSLASHYCRFLARLGDTLAFSAAIPGQGGTNHINEQPNSYWITKLTDAGFTHDADETTKLRALWSKLGVTWYYAKNVMLFRKN